MSSKFLKELNTGLANESRLLVHFESFFKDNLEKTKRCNRYDYEGITGSYELKCRTNNYNTYPTTCIALDKINPNHTKKQIYIFNFIDGTYYIEYHKELFDNFEIKDFKRYRSYYNDIKKPYMYIPIEQLTRIN